MSKGRWKRFREAARIDVIGERDTGSFLMISLVVGAIVGLAIALLIKSLEWGGQFSDFLDRTLAGGHRWFFLVLVPVAFLGAWELARHVAPEVEGDGVPETIAALHVRGGTIPARTSVLKILATVATIGAGGSAGREGPAVQVGGSIGSTFARRFGLGEDQIRSLVAAGAGAGIGATFNAPIAGMLFAMEVILGTFSVRHLSAVVVASVAASVTTQSIVGKEHSLNVLNPPEFQHPQELLLYAGLGVLVFLVGFGLLKLLGRTEGWSERLPGPAWVRPLAAGVVMGGIGMADPRLLGTGQTFVSGLLQLGQAQSLVWWVLIALALGKVVATSITLSGGGSGGAFMPNLFIGAALGAGFARLIEPVWHFSTLEPAAFAVVGMAAAIAAVARAPLTAILLVFEITRDYGLVLPLMLAAGLATILIDRFHPETVYTMPLIRQGIRLTRTGELDLLDTVTVGEVMTQPKEVARATMTLAEAQDLMDRYRHHGMPVLDDENHLVGIVTITDILRAGGPSERTTVAEAMTGKPITVGPATPVSRALERMAVLAVGRLPVVADDRSAALVGVFRREDAVRAYHQALGATTDHAMHRERLRQRTGPDVHYYDYRIPRGSMADGVEVKDVHWPQGSTLVSVRRGTEVIIPQGATVLRAGDVVTAFGTAVSRKRTIDRLNAGAEEPTAELELDAIKGETTDDGDVITG